MVSVMGSELLIDLGGSRMGMGRRGLKMSLGGMSLKGLGGYEKVVEE